MGSLLTPAEPEVRQGLEILTNAIHEPAGPRPGIRQREASRSDLRVDFGSFGLRGGNAVDLWSCRRWRVLCAAGCRRPKLAVFAGDVGFVV